MRLTVYADYALRVLMYVALKREGLATITEIADRYGISRNHLMKVVHQLGLLGYLENVRGRGGGIRLAKPASAINIGEVIRRVEDDMVLVQCFGSAVPRCRIESSCVLRSVLGEALGAFLGVLDRYTLADLVEPQHALSQLLDINTAGFAPPPQATLRPGR